jgi:hypothetical protein
LKVFGLESWYFCLDNKGTVLSAIEIGGKSVWNRLLQVWVHLEWVPWLKQRSPPEFWDERGAGRCHCHGGSESLVLKRGVQSFLSFQTLLLIILLLSLSVLVSVSVIKSNKVKLT